MANSGLLGIAATNMTATFNRDGGLGTNTYSRSNLTWTSSANNTRQGFEARAKYADILRDKIVNIILDSVQQKIDKSKQLV